MHHNTCIQKNVASTYVIARRGLGLKEKIPKVYKDLLKKLKANIEEKLFQGLWGDPIRARAPASGGGGGSL